MSGPFVFEPKASGAPPSPTPYVRPFRQQQQHSPLIPQHYFPPSPGLVPVTPGWIPGTPVAIPGTPRRVRFDDESQCPAMDGRPRSWHASDVPGWYHQGSPNLVPVMPASPGAVPMLLGPPSMGHQRRHSFGQQMPQWAAVNPWGAPSPWQAAPPLPSPPAPPKEIIHPFLDGKNPHSEFYFDLSAPSFNPQRRHKDGRLAPITDKELDEVATYPGIRKMSITGESIPQWPIQLNPQPQSAPSPIMGLGLEVPAWANPPVSADDSMPPITLRDVLESIYLVLQTQITQLEWAKLSKTEEHAVGRAYTRRCKAAAAVSHEEAELQADTGVKKVDFLLDKFMFRGLRAAKGSDGFENMHLVLSGSGR